MNGDQNKAPIGSGPQSGPSEPPFPKDDQSDTEKELLENFQGPDVPEQTPSTDIRTMKDDITKRGGEPVSSQSPPPHPPSPPSPSPPPPPRPFSPPPPPKPGPVPPPPPRPAPAPPPRPAPPPPPPRSPAGPVSKIERPGYEEPSGPVFRPEAAGSPGTEPEDEKGERGKKKIFVIAGVVVGIIFLGFLGYFLVVPLLFPPLVEIPEEITAEPVETQEPVEPVLEVPETLVHRSLFVVQPDETVEIELPDFDYRSTVRTFLSTAALETLPDGSTKEVVLKVSGSQFPFSEFLSNFSLPGTDVPPPPFIDVGQFEEDFTAFLYYDKDGVWPGYIAEIKSDRTLAQVMLNVLNAEDAINIAEFYLSDYSPGGFGEFKDGQANDVPTRYQVGPDPGAAFNYGVFGNYFVLSTSYNGLLEALLLLGI